MARSCEPVHAAGGQTARGAPSERQVRAGRLHRNPKKECDAAGGKFHPKVFGWMVHVYPFEQRPEDIWSVERQAHGVGHVD